MISTCTLRTPAAAVAVPETVNSSATGLIRPSIGSTITVSIEARNSHPMADGVMP